jgi:hypothetical protein
VEHEYPDFKKNTDFSRDMFNIIIGVIAQTLLVVIPLYLILHQNIPLVISILTLGVCVIILKKIWWNNIKRESNNY